MNEKDFLYYYMLGVPLMIWSTTFILAFIRIYHRSHRDLSEERKKWEEQQRVPAHQMRERRIVRRRRRHRRSGSKEHGKGQKAASRPTVERGSRGSVVKRGGSLERGSGGSKGSGGVTNAGFSQEKYRPENKVLRRRE